MFYIMHVLLPIKPPTPNFDDVSIIFDSWLTQPLEKNLTPQLPALFLLFAIACCVVVRRSFCYSSTAIVRDFGV